MDTLNKGYDNSVLGKRKTKSPYTSPQIQVYGDLREITHAVGKTNKADNGGGSTNKTGLP